MERHLLSSLNAERAARRAVAVVTDLGSGESRLVREREVDLDPLSSDVLKAIRSGKSALVRADEREAFVNAYLPPARIVVIGAVHISQALAPMAAIAGFDVEIIDPRTAFATPERFPNVALHAEWPQDILAQRPLDPYTALVAITHDPKIDDMPLIASLQAGCFYVGALGSRKTHGRRVERLEAAGLTADEIGRIEAPIGADIGASTPGEIAVAILASVIAAFRKRSMRAEIAAAATVA
ncbi:XdhC family protein [Mangrovicella endophytica]|uniref:XdhC family protein n=1 Tax=Mangrovicella endophytica TaxID=2066697 RepID=UPI000C9E8509|nr:XdhC family protein [Mangrovicella endophytica]